MLCVAAALQSGCLVTGSFQFEQPAGVLMSGRCMCAWCLDSRFCFREIDQDTILIGEGDSCPAGYRTATAASEVVDFFTKSTAPFYCVAGEEDQNKNTDAPLSCFAPVDEQLTFGNVGTCLDVPRSCLAAGECPGIPDPAGPGCPSDTQTGEWRTRCGEVTGPDYMLGITEGEVKGTTKLINSCASVHGSDVPTGTTPGRYCFLGCREDESNCTPTLTDPPEVTLSSLRVAIDPAASHATITVSLDGELHHATFPVTGELYIDVPQDCIGPLPDGEIASCDGAVLRWVHAEGVGVAFLAGVLMFDLAIHNTQPLVGDALTIGAQGFVNLPPTQYIHASAWVDGVGLSASDYLPNNTLIVSIDWANRTAVGGMLLFNKDGNVQMQVGLQGSILNLPPRADAGPDQALECAGASGASTTLSAAASSDPDGPDDIASYQWTWMDGSTVGQSYGTDLAVSLQNGASRSYTLAVTDGAGAADLDAVTVAVTDTSPPLFEQVEPVTDCLWPPDHRLHLFRLGEEIAVDATDVCDATPWVRIVDVASNEPVDDLGDGHTEPDIVFGSGAVCLRAERSGKGPKGRTYTVTLEARDDDGNASYHQLDITVPHDQRRIARCSTGSLAPAVDDGDPRCVASSPEPVDASLADSR